MSWIEMQLAYTKGRHFKDTQSGLPWFINVVRLFACHNGETNVSSSRDSISINNMPSNSNGTKRNLLPRTWEPFYCLYKAEDDKLFYSQDRLRRPKKIAPSLSALLWNSPPGAFRRPFDSNKIIEWSAKVQCSSVIAATVNNSILL